jgi:hypothetical protein
MRAGPDGIPNDRLAGWSASQVALWPFVGPPGGTAACVDDGEAVGLGLADGDGEGSPTFP